VIIVLDSGFLIALERRNQKALAVVDAIEQQQIPTFVPAGVLAQVWRDSPRQHAISKLIKSQTVKVVPFDEFTALKVGKLLADSGTSDLVDAHVAILAQKMNAIVYTSDIGDISALIPALELVRI